LHFGLLRKEKNSPTVFCFVVPAREFLEVALKLQEVCAGLPL
jgi:hypothetical protein